MSPVFCNSDDTQTGTAAELARKPEYLCPALIHRPNHLAVQTFRLIGEVDVFALSAEVGVEIAGVLGRPKFAVAIPLAA
jgi:hypothetical protein